ncbi:MAG TPA: sigma-54 dependent transcriptional regulator [Acidobacteriota bacterium]|nr:sigma-54 dependent transcriptional regulator [Acidobacteriota bacterium]
MDRRSYPPQPVLIVDDAEEVVLNLERILKSNGIDHVIACTDSREVIETIDRHGVEVMLLDLNMPHISGAELIDQLRLNYPEVMIIVVTGTDEVEIAVGCMRKGAYDYLVKPVEKNRLLSTVKRATEQQEMRREMLCLKDNMLREELRNPDAFINIITKNNKMRAILRYVEAIAATSYPVLISGETGVGKELVAEAVHKASDRQGPFVAVNVAGLDDNIFSDTLFGHVRGAYTGADRDRPGMIESAATGTLFLDEIGDLAMATQVKLLRLLQNGDYFPLGSDRPKRSSARILVSTNRDLQKAQEDGSFRKDLFYRLRTHHIHVPPLRERIDDLALLLDHFLDETSRTLDRHKPTPPPELLVLLANYDFPGNVRELQVAVQDAVARHRSGKLSMEVFRELLGQREELPITDKTPDGIFSGEDIVFPGKIPTLQRAEEILIREALSRTGNNRTLAAELLGVTRQTIHRKLKLMKDQ